MVLAGSLDLSGSPSVSYSLRDKSMLNMNIIIGSNHSTRNININISVEYIGGDYWRQTVIAVIFLVLSQIQLKTKIDEF